MSVKILLRVMFVLWVMPVVGLSVISYPGSKDLLMSIKLTRSSFVVHGAAYFLGISLCYFSFAKKRDPSETSVCDREPFGLFHGASGDRRSEIRSRISEDGKGQMTEQGDLSQGMIAFGKDDSLREGWVDDKNWMNRMNSHKIKDQVNPRAQ